MARRGRQGRLPRLARHPADRPADRALVGERVDGSTVNTEVLAHLEGFIMAFPKEDHAKANPQRSVYDQLTGVAEHWASASPDVQQEAVKRHRSR